MFKVCGQHFSKWFIISHGRKRSMYKRANHAMKSLESLSAYLGRLALVASVYATLDLSMNFGVNKFSVRIYCLKLKFDA